MPTEKRQNHRFSPSQDFDPTLIQAFLLNKSRRTRFPVSLIDLSPGGAQISLPLVNAKNPDDLKQLALAFDNGEQIQLAVTPIHLHPTHDGYHAGIQFNHIPDDLLRNLCYLFVQKSSHPPRPLLSQLKTFGLETRPDKIRDFFKKHSAKHSTWYLYPDQDSQPVGKVRLEHIDPDHVRFPIQGSYQGSSPFPLKPGSSCILALSEANTVYFFNTQIQPSPDPDSPHLVSLTLPDSFTRGGIRSAARTLVPPDLGLYVEFIHPYRSGVLLRKPIHDLSIQGLSFHIDLWQDLLCQGMRIHSVVLRLPDSPPISCSMVIHNVHPIDNSSLYHCGVELIDFVGTSQSRWVQRALSFLAPDIREAGPWDLDTVWNVYDESGYLEEKERSLLETQRGSFAEKWLHLSHSPQNGRIFLFEDQGKSIATIATSRIYSHTWVIHQLAAMIDRYSQSDNKLDVLYQLIPQSLFHWFVGLQEDACVIGTIDATRRLNQWIWEQFKRFTDGLHSEVQDLGFYSFSLAKLPAPDHPQTLEISSPTEAELLNISKDLLEKDGPLAHQVFDYGVDKLSLSFWNHVHESSLIGHQRHIWVARVFGQMRGYCLVENAKAGVNIFSIYNTMRILVNETDPQLAQDIRQQLFDRAIRYYRQHNIDSMIYAAGPHELPPPTSNYVSKNQALRLVANSQHLPLIISYLADHWH